VACVNERKMTLGWTCTAAQTAADDMLAGKICTRDDKALNYILTGK
jgi:hypothetical protein